jgi:hypothetical protein
VPAQKQLFDGVTGIYVSKKMKGVWIKPERVLLQDPGQLALDGAQFIQGNTISHLTILVKKQYRFN